MSRFTAYIRERFSPFLDQVRTLLVFGTNSGKKSPPTRLSYPNTKTLPQSYLIERAQRTPRSTCTALHLSK